MKKYIWSLLLTILSVCSAYAQTTITGVVKDESGETLPGVSIMIKGTTQGTVTDISGAFTLKVQDPTKDVIKISFIGMKDVEIPLNGSTSGINVAMSPSEKQLSEVVVMGYGTQKRKDLTGAVSSINPDNIKDLPISSPMEALAGRMAGVSVQTSDGSPDATVRIRVRGGGSITQTNDPLFVVDGFKVPAATFNSIPPRDIESLDVLKDASSTAIYGAEGANGVVIATTKAAKQGRITVNFNAFYGAKKTYNLPKPLNPYEFVYYQRELMPAGAVGSFGAWENNYGNWEDVDIYKSEAGQNWVNRIFNNTTSQQNYNLSVSGGSDKLSMNLSLTHDDQGFIMDNSHYRRENLSLRTSSKLSEKITLDFTDRLSYTNITGPDPTAGGLVREAVQYRPLNSLTQNSYDAIQQDDMSLEALGSLNNPLADVNNSYKQQYLFENTVQTGLSFKFSKDFSVRVQGTYSFIRNSKDEIWTKNTGQSSQNGGFPVAQRTFTNGNRYSVTPYINYAHQFNKNNRVDVVFGGELSNEESDQTLMYSKLYPATMTFNDILGMWNMGTPNPTYTTINEPVRTLSYYGRANYALMDRYIFNVQARRDAKNYFASSLRWGLFPGAGFAWKISEESFLKDNNVISNLKLRLTIGEAGNARINTSYRNQEWPFESSASKLAYFNISGVEQNPSAIKTPTTLYNPDLTWETTISRNLGFDFGLFKDRVTGSIDLYKNTVKNLILQTPMPTASGYQNQYRNIGQTSNKGLEISLSGYIVNTKDFRLDANFNIAFNKNMVDKYVQPSSMIQSGAPYSALKYDYLVQEGKPVGQMIGFVTDGVYTFDDFYFDDVSKNWKLYGGKVNELGAIANAGGYMGPGMLKLKDMDGDGVISETGTLYKGVQTAGDKVVIGHAQPLHTGGFGLNSRWKWFDLSTQFTWSYGNDVYNVNKIVENIYSGSKTFNNITTDMSLDKRFTTIDPATGRNIMYGTYADPVKLRQLNANSTMFNPIINSYIPLSLAIEDGSFLRMSSLTLGFTIPENVAKRAFISKLRFYGTIYNVFILTKYSGQDPEVSTSTSNLCPGRDYSAYPKARNFVMGANLTF